MIIIGLILLNLALVAVCIRKIYRRISELTFTVKQNREAINDICNETGITIYLPSPDDQE